MFSELLKALRSEKGLSQSQLAKEVGVSTGNIGDWEIGRSKPGYAALASLAQFFEVSSDYLLGLSLVKTVEKETHPQILCDGIPLTESEADLVAMYRFLGSDDRKTIFDIAKMKYDMATGEKVSIYSTYSDTNEKQKSDPHQGDKTKSGTA